MLKKYRNAGATIPAEQLKQIKGGTLGPVIQMLACIYPDNSCPGPCAPGKAFGNVCIDGLCRRMPC